MINKINNILYNKVFFIIFFLGLIFILNIHFLLPVFDAKTVIITYGFNPFDISNDYFYLWQLIKKLYILFLIFSSILLSNSFYNLLIKNILINKTNLNIVKENNFMNNINNLNNTEFNSEDNLNLFIGTDEKNNKNIFIPEKGLFQNLLITGTTGTGKTSSAMYPFLNQLIKYKNNEKENKIGLLVLDVKGTFYLKVLEYAKIYNRLDDIIVIELGGKFNYNPLDKPNLKPLVLANRLKTILELFSPNSSESYWLDKSEKILEECIKLCRLYNDNYVTFLEIHKLISDEEYYKNKINILKKLFQSGKLSKSDTYNLLSSLDFFEKEFNSLDSRTLSILKSEITRITGTFISDIDTINTFCPEKNNKNFNGFKQVIDSGKIVVLNMNIAEYKNLSKIIAAYLKLDFQSEVLRSISNNSCRITGFISDEYHEYLSSTDANFFALSREAKCINIVATQSYTSLLNSIKDEYSVKVITQNLINKLWFRTDDIFTIEETQKQLGKEDKRKISKSITENAKETNFSYFTNSLKSKNSNLSESLSTYTQNDFIYDASFFTKELETFTALCFLSDGNKILEPCKINLIPDFKKF